jgi:predicted nucleic acid-binding protein
MSSFPVCVDASLVVRVVMAPSDHIRNVWEEWDAEGRRLVAPTLLYYELANAILQYQRSGQVSATTAQQALEAALQLPIEPYGDRDLNRRALALASAYGLTATYDAHYLALAERLRAELWTADRRLARAVQPKLDWVHYVEP